MARPVRPEPKFFLQDNLYAKGMIYYQTAFFGDKPSAWLRGEKSTSYIESEKAACRIAQHFPEAKVLVLLRDPIERAISNYWLTASFGLETLPMAEAFLLEEERRENYDRERVSVSPFAYLKRGRYIDYLDFYQLHFPEECLRVMLYEDTMSDLGSIQDLYQFLGVASDFAPPLLDQVVDPGDKPTTELDGDVLTYLRDYFWEANALLAARFGLDLTSWTSTAR
jgi:hypothetical protein